MRALRAWLLRWAGLFKRAQRDRELSEELEAHIQLHIEDNIRLGISEEEARRQALVRLGSIVSVTESYRDRRGLPLVDSLVQDVRFGLRMLRKHRGYTAAAVLTLALGIGATTAIATVVDHVIVRPLSYPEADRLYAVHELVPRWAAIAPQIPVNAMHFREWRKTTRSFDQMALIGQVRMNLTGSGDPERLDGARVSPALFTMLGVHPQLGRLLAENEDRPGPDNVVVLTDGLWKRRFGGNPGIIGHKISLDDRPYKIVGVLPPDFRFPKISHLYAMTIAAERPEIWKPFALKDDELVPFSDWNFACIVRLARGVNQPQAEAELNAAQTRIAAAAPEKIDLQAALVPLRDQITGRSQTGLRLMAGAVAAVLLIACVNVMNLLLARLTTREREIAIRRTLGASRGRLVRQLLIESLLLALAGGTLGVAIAYGALDVLVASAPVDLPRMEEVQLDGRVLAFATIVTMLSAFVFGTWPAWKSADVLPQGELTGGSRTMTAARGHSRFRSSLVAIEVALTTVCLIAGGLLLHSFVKLLTVDKGFETSQTVVVALNLPDSRYDEMEKRASFLRLVLNRLSAMSGVTSVGIINRLPLSGEGGNNTLIVEGRSTRLAETPIADIRAVNPDYFRTVGVPLRVGQIFSERDRARPVVLVSVFTADRLWPQANPIGRRLRIGAPDSPWHEVIGVVGDVRGVSLEHAPSLTAYVPYWERPWGYPSVLVKTIADPFAIAPQMRAAIRQLDPDLPVSAVRSMDDIVVESVAPRRFQMTLIMLFAALAVLLASIGVFGVVSYSVARRRPEVGIRMALGAEPASIHRLVLRQGLLPVALGLAGGLLVALATGRILEGALFGVSSQDPLTFAGVISVLLLVSVIAMEVPARRAQRIDPVAALRVD